MMIRAFENHCVTTNGLFLVFACVAFANDGTVSVVSEDEGRTLKVVYGDYDVNILPIYASAQLTGDIQKTG